MYDIVLIGGGAAGLSVASGAAQLGMKVGLVDRQLALGGDCLHTGCVPSKTLIESAKVMHTVRQASHFGVKTSDAQVDFNRVMERVREVIATIQQHDHVDRFKALGCDVIHSKAMIRSDIEVVVSNQVLRSKSIVIATGSRPRIPDIQGLSEVPYYTSDTIFEIKKLPTSMVILGGGAIALELAQAFARFGTQVTVLESNLEYLGHINPSISEMLLGHLRADGVKLSKRVTVTKVAIKDGSIQCFGDEEGHPLALECEALLVAVGRVPNIEELNLERVGVATSPQGILTNRRLQTSVKHIYAMGDVVAGPHHFTHMAASHASVILSNIAFGFPKGIEQRVVPSVIYTDPELATVGWTSPLATMNKVLVDKCEAELSMNDRAQAMGTTQGCAELLTRRGQIVGATLLAPSAGELIAPIALSMKAKLSLVRIAGTLFAYPTLSLWVQQLVGKALGPVVFSETAKKWVRWILSWDLRQ